MDDDQNYKLLMFMIVFLYTLVVVGATYMLTKYVFLAALCAK